MNAVITRSAVTLTLATALVGFSASGTSPIASANWRAHQR